MKLKTKQAATKRFVMSARGKVKRRKTRQAHFNARATGGATRKKHHYYDVAPADLPRLKQLLPHN